MSHEAERNRPVPRGNRPNRRRQSAALSGCGCYPLSVWHDGKALRVTRLLIEIHYLPDGRWEWCEYETDTRKSQSKRNRKWRASSSGMGPIPTWDEAHEAQYIGPMPCGTRELQHAPMPVSALAARIAYDIHCLGVDESRRQAKAAKLKSPR